MFHEQREFTRQLNALVSTSDNLRNLTVAANQASAAKADFVAGMSHELRTPLNAIIGYSQLLLEEARDEDDEATVKDLSHVHKAGTDLLRLIDDILDLSRIDAGKMPVNPATDSICNRLPRWIDGASALLTGVERSIALTPGNGDGAALHTDWTAAESVVRHLIAGIVSPNADGALTVWVDTDGDGLAFTLVDTDATGFARAIVISQEMFEHGGDVSSTKYGSTGIEIALSYKFAGLLGGTIRSITLADGRPATQILLPNLVAPDRLAA
jgi:signal transduction histidine kinase